MWSFCDSVNAIAIAIQRWLSLDSAGFRHPALVVAIQRWPSLANAKYKFAIASTGQR